MTSSRASPAARSGQRPEGVALLENGPSRRLPSLPGRRRSHSRRAARRVAVARPHSSSRGNEIAHAITGYRAATPGSDGQLQTTLDAPLDDRRGHRTARPPSAPPHAPSP